MNDKGRSHQTTPSTLLNRDGIPSRDGKFAHGLHEHRHFGGAVVAWRSPPRVVGDSALSFTTWLGKPAIDLGSLVRDDL